MRRLTVVLTAFACVACAAGPTPGVPASSTVASTVQVGALSFSLPSADDLRAVETPWGATGEYILPIRPTVQRPNSSAIQLQNGNFEIEHGFASPFGETWVTTSVLTARITAANGPVDVYAQSTVTPIVRAWASDGALFTAYHRMPNLGELRAGIVRPHDPNATATEANIVKHVGWPLAYVSAARHEALFFYASGVVMRVQWEPNSFTEANVPVSKETAIATVVAALRDPAAMSEEARTGVDYFLGVPYKGVLGPPEWEVNRHDDLVPTYDIPDGVDWQGFLSTGYANKPVWYIGSTWGGGGQVDARTGTLIRFTRMRVGHGTGGPPPPLESPAP